MSTRHPSQQIAQRDRQVLDHLLSIASLPSLSSTAPETRKNRPRPIPSEREVLTYFAPVKWTAAVNLWD